MLIHYVFQARGMQEVAQMVFRALRTDPYKLESQLIALTRAGRPGRRPQISEIRGPRTRLPRLGGFKIGASPLGKNHVPLMAHCQSKLIKRLLQCLYRACGVKRNTNLVSSLSSLNRTKIWWEF